MVDPMRLIALALLAVSGPLLAQSADPTRPPATWLMPVDEAKPGEEGGGTFRLQSVLIAQGRRPVAVIGGQTVALGGRVGEATLVRLTEREAVLKGADGVTHLFLTPDVEKQMIVTPKPRKKGKSGTVKGSP
ncbi:MSHA biogenesis protein MshK [Dechloromonas sp. HYN0024]|uniref:MSHA biogenesis protein MshK n=1 Tax=Dechloromonas sp. HYN0024 TaxID=2231055 RepID=UPI0013C33D42|nr:MSHA biogenesis protein MshK [Dechloromonas sp. HYN0024]